MPSILARGRAVLGAFVAGNARPLKQIHLWLLPPFTKQTTRLLQTLSLLPDEGVFMAVVWETIQSAMLKEEGCSVVVLVLHEAAIVLMVMLVCLMPESDSRWKYCQVKTVSSCSFEEQVPGKHIRMFGGLPCHEHA